MLKLIKLFFFKNCFALKPDELREVLGYQKRLSRNAVDVDSSVGPSHEMMFVSRVDERRKLFIGFGTYVVRATRGRVVIQQRTANSGRLATV